MIAYSYGLIVGPTCHWFELLFKFKLIQRHPDYKGMTNGELHNYLVSLR